MLLSLPMCLGLERKSVRERTAYRAGRVAVDVLLVLWGIATLVLLVLFFLAYRDAIGEGAANVLEVTLAVAGAVIGSVALLAVRELAHAVFDMADRAGARQSQAVD